jgi:hypothetical protein
MEARMRWVRASLVCACVLGLALSAAGNTTFTLSDAALLSLDNNLNWYYSPDPSAQVVAVRDVPGPGVEFDIQFFGTGSYDYFVFLVSSAYGGAGTLAGMDIGGFDHIALQFTFMAVNGQPVGGGRRLGVGAVIAQGWGFRFREEVLTFDNTPPSVLVSTSFAGLGWTYASTVGFTALLDAQTPWSPTGDLITLRVAPAPGATQLPAPAVVQGDLNCDGSVNFGDINPFVLCLSNFAAWQTTYPSCLPQNGDINDDGTYGQGSFGDINPFIVALSGGQ